MLLNGIFRDVQGGGDLFVGHLLLAPHPEDRLTLWRQFGDLFAQSVLQFPGIYIRLYIVVANPLVLVGGLQVKFLLYQQMPVVIEQFVLEHGVQVGLQGVDLMGTCFVLV